jgi:hypothetical protein
MKVATRCPNRCHRHQFSRTTMPDGRYDKLLCDKCGNEVVVKMPLALCQCGSRDFIVRPKTGHAMEDGYMMRCAKCAEFVTLDYLLTVAETDNNRKQKTKNLVSLVLFIIIIILICIISIFVKN